MDASQVLKSYQWSVHDGARQLVNMQAVYCWMVGDVPLS